VKILTTVIHMIRKLMIFYIFLDVRSRPSVTNAKVPPATQCQRIRYSS